MTLLNPTQTYIDQNMGFDSLTSYPLWGLNAKASMLPREKKLNAGI